MCPWNFITFKINEWIGCKKEGQERYQIEKSLENYQLMNSQLKHLIFFEDLI